VTSLSNRRSSSVGPLEPERHAELSTAAGGHGGTPIAEALDESADLILGAGPAGFESPGEVREILPDKRLAAIDLLTLVCKTLPSGMGSGPSLARFDLSRTSRDRHVHVDYLLER